jgi:hypothetical protein
MLMYPPPAAGTRPGKPAPPGPSACSSGGWFMTSASMRRVLDGLITGNRLLSPSQRQLMGDNCLGWDCSLNGKADNYLSKTGGFGDSSASLQIFFGILAGTIPVVVATNSDLGHPLETVVQTAQLAATSAR